MKKILLTSISILSLVLGITYVFGNFINFKKNINFFDSNSKNIITSSEKLNSNIIIFKSNTNISKYKINTNCKNEQKYIGKKENLYFFNFKLLDNNCENPNFSLTDGKQIFIKSNFKLKIENKYKIYSQIIDYPTNDIEKLNKVLLERIKKYSKYKNSSFKSFSNLKKNRIYEELKYKQKIVSSILNRRNSKYSVPVKGYKIATGLNVIPNAARNYRKHYTDGIHHGWDIMAPKGTMTSAIDDGIIIRVVKNFKFADLRKLVKNGKISEIQKLRNLDILRGNQVWLKTSKGDVMFYSHLGEIPENIVEGAFVSVGTNIGKIDKTGVPDKNYTNFHLHFPIMKNPYNIKKATKYSWEDYMAWDWYLKGLTPDEIIIQQKKIFAKEAFENK